MGIFGKLFGKGKSKQEEPQAKSESGTMLRRGGLGVTKEKPGPGLTTLEIAEQGAWAVKMPPVWDKGDKVLGTYLIEDMFEGGMGRVYIAEHKDWKTKLAIKQPNEMMLSQKDLFARILREANSWVELGLHPNIAYCYYVRNIEDVPHIVVEYVDGGNLLEWIADGKCLDYKTNLDLALQFCHGMEWAHKKGMIHRDIKPENVLMTKDGLLKITDFGLVRGGDGPTAGAGRTTASKQVDDSNLTTIGDFMGTAGYMAPEQAKDAAGVDERADIFSFGVCMYEMFCGARPYDTTVGEKQEPPEPAKVSLDDNFPPDLAELLKQCIQWNRDDRPGKFEDIRRELISIRQSLFNEPGPYAELELVELEADGLNNRGVSLMDLGRVDDAMACWQDVNITDPTHPPVVYNLSLLQWRRGEITDAEVLDSLGNCRNNPSVDREVLSELMAMIHVARFDPDSAKKELEDRPGRFEALFSDSSPEQIKCLWTMKGHTSRSSVSISADGRWAVSGSNGKPMRSRGLNSEGHGVIVNGVELIVEGSSVALWDFKTGQCLRTMKEHYGFLGSVSISADGQRAVSAVTLSDFMVILWDADTGQSLRIMKGHTEVVASVSINADGRRAVSGGADETVRLWDLDMGRCLWTMEGHTVSVNSVSISADGLRAVSGSGDYNCRKDCTIRFWDLETGQCLRIMEGHTNGVNSVSISSDGRRAVSGSGDKTVRLWDLESGQCLRTLEGHTASVNSVSLSADGQRVVSGSFDKTVRLWDLESGQCLRTLEGHTGGVTSVSISADGRRVVSGSNDGTVHFWELPVGNAPFLFQACRPKGFFEIKQEQEALNHALALSDRLFQDRDYTASYRALAEAWQIKDYAEIPSIVSRFKHLAQKGRIKEIQFLYQLKTMKEHSERFHSVSISADGRRAVSGSGSGYREVKKIHIWDLETGHCLRTMEWDTGHLHSVNISADGVRAVSGGSDVQLWDLEAGQCLRTMGGTYAIYSVSISSDGRRAVSGSGDKTVRLWDLESGQCLRTLEGHTASVTSVSISADGCRAVSGSGDKTVRLWDLESGQCLRTLKGHTVGVNSVSISADGRRAVSGGFINYYSKYNTVRLWDLETGECLRTMEGHTLGVYSVSISADGRRAVSGSLDHTVRLWDLEAGQCLRTMEGHTAAVRSVCFSPDGLMVLSASDDKTIIVWRLIWDLEFD